MLLYSLIVTYVLLIYDSFATPLGFTLMADLYIAQVFLSVIHHTWVEERPLCTSGVRAFT